MNLKIEYWILLESTSDVISYKNDSRDRDFTNIRSEEFSFETTFDEFECFPKISLNDFHSIIHLQSLYSNQSSLLKEECALIDKLVEIYK